MVLHLSADIRATSALLNDNAPNIVNSSPICYCWLLNKYSFHFLGPYRTIYTYTGPCLVMYVHTCTNFRPCFNTTYKAFLGQVMFSVLFTEEKDTSHRLEEQMVGAAQWIVREHMVLKGTVQEQTMLKGTVQEQTVVQADLVEAAHKMEAGHRVVLLLGLPVDHMWRICCPHPVDSLRLCPGEHTWQIHLLPWPVSSYFSLGWQSNDISSFCHGAHHDH